jgi:hypothetical protein
MQIVCVLTFILHALVRYFTVLGIFIEGKFTEFVRDHQIFTGNLAVFCFL